MMQLTVKTAADLVAAARERIRELSPQEAQAQLHSGTPPLLLDLREGNEYAQGHIREAISLPRGLLEFKLGELTDQHPAQPILVYCQSGGRAALAADQLQQMGYTHVHSIAGGIQAWQEAGLPVATTDADLEKS